MHLSSFMSVCVLTNEWLFLIYWWYGYRYFADYLFLLIAL